MSVLLAAVLIGCATSTPRSTGVASPAPAAQPSSPAHAAADVAFMQGMIPHHRQALAMTALVPERTGTEAIRLLAERIEVSQTDEIAMMVDWLESRGESVPAEEAHGAHTHGHAHGAGHGGTMPGMLTAEEMSRLASARGPEFDRLFLEFMIRHHQGALVMVDELFSAPGAGQEVDVFRIASEIDSDQRIEIERMQRMLNTLE